MNDHKDDDERMKNFVLFKTYATDKELDKYYADPIVISGIVIVLIVIILFVIFVPSV